jgi:O-antigen/teichoic acid export membrane protein
MSETGSPVRQFFRSSGIMAVLYAGSTALTFVVGLLLARLLGASGYGVYALAMTTATLVGLVTEFGLPVLAMRETGAARASGDWGLLRGLLRWSDRAIVALSMVLVAGTLAVLWYTGAAADSAYLQTMIWALALVPLVGLGKVRSLVLLALGRVAAGQFAVMILRPLVFIALIGILALGFGRLTPVLAMIAQASGALAALVMVAVLFVRARPAELGTAAPRYAAREWLHACLPMGLTEGLRLLQGQLALLLVGWLTSTAAAGIYRVADAVLQMTTIVASIVATAATPMFARMHKEGDRAGIERIGVLSAWAMFGGVVALGLPLVVLGPWIIPAVFGPEFAASAPICAVLWLGMAATYSLGLATSIANMTGHHVLTTQALVIIVAINAVLGLVLVPQFGALGAAVAMATGLFAGNAWCAWRLRRLAGYNPTLYSRAAFRILRETGTAGWLRLTGRPGEN